MRFFPALIAIGKKIRVRVPVRADAAPEFGRTGTADETD
jgi:hypothetical protein